jgi:hypothetical protein
MRRHPTRSQPQAQLAVDQGYRSRDTNDSHALRVSSASSVPRIADSVAKPVGSRTRPREPRRRVREVGLDVRVHDLVHERAAAGRDVHDQRVGVGHVEAVRRVGRIAARALRAALVRRGGREPEDVEDARGPVREEVVLEAIGGPAHGAGAARDDREGRAHVLMVTLAAARSRKACVSRASCVRVTLRARGSTGGAYPMDAPRQRVARALLLIRS